MKPTLMILAAGMASRYGSMKQVQGFGPGNETIMDYSIYDAIRAGFGKVVFIIRRDFADDFKKTFEPKLAGKIQTEYVYQEMHAHMDGFELPAGRTKPWGTAHAVLCAADAVKEPFAVINADDFYGRDAFIKAADFLQHGCSPSSYAIIGYELRRTLSEHGSVSRGVCQADDKHMLVAINERTNIYRFEGHMIYEEKGTKNVLAEDTKVSMNFWCFDPAVFDLSEKMFHEFLKAHINEPKSEFFIPIVADRFINEGHGTISVIPTSSQWFGVTYKEDAPTVQRSLTELIEKGEYPAFLWKS